jgi:thiamine-monophosphate kinase
MVHGPDFRFAWSTPRDLGWKAAATNLADIAAMGATPTALVVALVAPVDTHVAVLEGIADGLREALAELAPGCGVVGGDLSASETLTIAVTAFGDLGGRHPVLRSGARAGDVVAVSGALGLAARGLSLLFERAIDENGAPDAVRAIELRPEFSTALDAQLAPHPPIADGVAAALAGATAMLDVSDGLVLDARRIAAASEVAIDLSTATLETEGAPMHEVLTGGEDHALLATFPPAATLPGGFRAIGSVSAGAGVTVDGHVLDERGGWDPYEDWNGARG